MQSKKRALGKGLAALLPAKSPAIAQAPSHILQAATTSSSRDLHEDKEALLQLPVDAISPNPAQPRQHFEEAALEELAASIRSHGLLQPVLVSRRSDRWILVAGERRWRAAQRAGLETIPAIALDISDREALELALVENLQREDLDPLEEARAYRVLIDRFGLSQEEVAQRVEKSRSAVANALRLLSLPEDLQDELRAGRLSAGHARALLALESAEDQRAFAELIIREGLSVRQIERLIQKHLARPISSRRRKAGVRTSDDTHLRDLRQRFEEVLACRVDIKMTGPNCGKIEIQFSSLDELDRIRDILGVSD